MTKCEIVGCTSDAIYIKRPMMSAGAYCKKHFFEIYYGEDVIEAAKSVSIESIESQVRAIVTDVIQDKCSRNHVSVIIKNGYRDQLAGM